MKQNVFNNNLNSSATCISSPAIRKEYTGKDGLLYCSVCNRKVQVEIEFLGTKRKVRCACECVVKERASYEARLKKEELDRRRFICFKESNMNTWNFENDDRKNEKLSDAMKRYVSSFPDFKEQGKGLLLYGNTGTGKTYFAACIANALIDNDYYVLMTSFARLTNQIQGKFEGKQEFIDDLNRFALLIIDDLGAERKSEYMQELVWNIIDARYRSGLPFIVTTNLTAEEIKKPQELCYQRIYDRLLERCIPIEVSGTSRRRQKVRENLANDKQLLGL